MSERQAVKRVRHKKRARLADELALQQPLLPVGAPQHCPRCQAPVRVEIVTDPQPPRWACAMGHSGLFVWDGPERDVARVGGGSKHAAALAAALA